MGGFRHISEGFLLVSILAILGAVAFPMIAERLGYSRALGGLGVVALYGIYFILNHFFLHEEVFPHSRPREAKEEGEATGARGRGSQGEERLAITAREQDGIVVLEANGILSLETWELFDRRLMAVLNAGKKSIIISLANVSWIDALGLGTLIRSLVKARAADAEIKLAEPRDQVRQVLERTGVAGKIEIFANVNEALDLLRKRPGP